MERDEFEALSPGDKVRIVSQWDKNGLTMEDEDGNMERYLAKIMTVSRICGSFLLMEEDHEEWVWNRHCIERKEDNKPVLISISFESIM